MPVDLPGEAFLHYVWRVKDLQARGLKTVNGKQIDIIKWGVYNRNSGPDFLDACIKIDGLIWTGSVEMHVKASDWKRHGHGGDPHYQNVILHVVYLMDYQVILDDGSSIETLELLGSIDLEKSTRYEQLIHNLESIPCGPLLHDINKVYINQWLDRIFFERIEQKGSQLKEELEELRYDWDQLFYQLVAKSLGQPINRDPFWELARITPIRKLQRLKGRGHAIEAILFGQSGLLSVQDDFSKRLYIDYQYFKEMIQIDPLKEMNWKFARMRPSNFPTRRIAQLAGWIENGDTRFKTFLESENVKTFEAKFSLTASDYWEEHTKFGKRSRKISRQVSQVTMVKIIANALLPIMLLYHATTDEDWVRDRALKWAQQMPPEDNRIIRKWKHYGVKPTNLAQSQALLQLTKFYCEEKRCLECAIGNKLLKAQNVFRR